MQSNNTSDKIMFIERLFKRCTTNLKYRNTSKYENHFIRSRRELYECMRLVMKNCPEAEEYLLMTGHDQTAIEKSIDVLCDNKNGKP